MRWLNIAELTPAKSKHLVNTSGCGNGSQDTALFGLSPDPRAYVMVSDPDEECTLSDTRIS